MKKYIYIVYTLLIPVILVSLFTATNSVGAQSATTQGRCSITPIINEAACKQAGGNWTTPYVLLAPLEGPDGTMSEFDPAQEGAFGKYLNTMIKIAIGLSAVMAVMMFVIGGIEYMTSELVHTKESAKSRMGGAVFGLVIALGAWALLNTINPNLLKSDISVDQATIEIALSDRVPQTATNGVYPNGVAVGTPVAGTIPPRCTTNTQTGCLPLYVTLNNPECRTVGQQNCTSTIGLDMSQLRAVQWGCRCPLVLSGGTEWWLHGGRTGRTNHQSGRSTVDIRTNSDPNNPLNRYLSGGQPLVPNQSYNSPVGPVIYEGDHWHIGT